MPRYWGFWTRGKLDLLRRYLDAFTTASKGQSEIVYLDLFGGQPKNRERLTNEDLDGSARIALSTTNPPFSRLRFFELEPFASRLRTALEAGFPGRDFEVVPGDCSATLGAALRSLAPMSWAPTFAFVDPNGPDVHWSTLETIAKFKKPNLTKPEIWLLFAAGMFIRTLRADGTAREVDTDKLDRMYGTAAWRAIYQARVSGSTTLKPPPRREGHGSGCTRTWTRGFRTARLTTERVTPRFTPRTTARLGAPAGWAGGREPRHSRSNPEGRPERRGGSLPSSVHD